MAEHHRASAMWTTLTSASAGDLLDLRELDELGRGQRDRPKAPHQVEPSLLIEEQGGRVLQHDVPELGEDRVALRRVGLALALIQQLVRARVLVDRKSVV